jgi:hypothetical protein
VPNLLKVVAFGRSAGADVNKIENLAAAGLGAHVHVGNPSYAGQEIIDRAQNVESDVVKTAHIELPLVATAPIQHSTTAVSHTWTVVQRKPIVTDHITIPVHAAPSSIPGQHG